jgi:hypothetical protein
MGVMDMLGIPNFGKRSNRLIEAFYLPEIWI